MKIQLWYQLGNNTLISLRCCHMGYNICNKLEDDKQHYIFPMAIIHGYRNQGQKRK